MPGKSIDDRETCNDSPAAAVQPLPPGVSIGARVHVRGRAWRLDMVVPHDDCRELHLFDLRDERRRVLLWPHDRPVAVGDRPRFETVRLARWCRGLNAWLAHAAGPCAPRARLADGRVLPYQLLPAMSVARGASRIVLADEVGLGKTIQAGWIVADLAAREPDARVLIAVPAGLRRQWIAELERRFGIACMAVDAAWLRARVADLPADVLPWTAPGVYLGSLDFLKRADVSRSLQAVVWDLLVVDEAHTVTSPTERHAAFSAVASRARRVVLITATPYSGDPGSFDSMIAMGATPGEGPPVMFRRSRADAGDARPRRHRFARVTISRTEARLQRLLERYTRDVWDEAPDGTQGARLAMTILRKRALSSPAALACSLRRRLALLQGAAELPRQLGLFEDDEVDDEVPDAALAAPGLADGARERERLGALIDLAGNAVASDSKLRYLQRLLRRTNQSAVIFTEYRDSLLRLAAVLPSALQLHGGLDAAERSSVQARFNAEGGLLLATDAAAEGLNLHERCHVVINYELPWNPARLEQRIGRVDRIGQGRAVHAITLVARDTAEDLVIANLARRLALVVSTLGERDRLGAFLSDVQIARRVIAGESDEAPPAPARAAIPIHAPDPDEGVAAADTAGHIERARAAGSPFSGVLVSSVRSSRCLPPGVLVCVRHTLSTADGDIAASRLQLIHVAGSPGKPGASLARGLAARAAAVVRDLAIAPDVDAWIASVTAMHETRLERLLARERSMASRAEVLREVQPGLFDSRVLEQILASSAVDDSLDAEHRRRVGTLSRGAALHLTSTPVAVLISWR
jgi:superfamily II DNA or RNA helicase